jgi:hypothetical protein
MINIYGEKDTLSLDENPYPVKEVLKRIAVDASTNSILPDRERRKNFLIEEFMEN